MFLIYLNFCSNGIRSLMIATLLKILLHIAIRRFPGGCYKGHRWDAGWLQVRRMIFGRDRTTDDFLNRKESFDKTLNALGDKIAQAAYEDGVI